MIFSIFILLSEQDRDLSMKNVKVYGQELARGVHDHPNHVELTFQLVGPSNVTPDRVIYDVNDVTGGKVPPLFVNPNLRFGHAMHRGAVHMGVKIPINYNGCEEIGTMEAVNQNFFFVVAPAPHPSSLALLAARGITVTSGGLPLRRVLHETNHDGVTQRVWCTYIYADRETSRGSLVEGATYIS
uniref:hypothetical protein n=1 Tax=Pseudofabraea citricarpa TaxID=1664388 RepID=UPI0022FD916F|nr:hypothetical protein PN052_mgp17 [Pseudofabraea citricarpa]WAX38810.1 hypothetical protein [Pseudofabraea citricarpa]